MEYCSGGLRRLWRRIGEFFGVDDDEDGHLSSWREAFQERVKNGDVGLSFEHAVSSSNFQNQREKVVSQLEKSMSQIVMDTDNVGMSNHLLSQSSHFLISPDHIDKVQSQLFERSLTEISDPQDPVQCDHHSNDLEPQYLDLESELSSNDFQEDTERIATSENAKPCQSVQSSDTGSFKSVMSTFNEVNPTVKESKSSNGEHFYNAHENFNQSALQNEKKSSVNTNAKKINLNNHKCPNSQNIKKDLSNLDIFKNNTSKSTRFSNRLKEINHSRNAVFPINIRSEIKDYENKNNNVKTDDGVSANQSENKIDAIEGTSNIKEASHQTENVNSNLDSNQDTAFTDKHNTRPHTETRVGANGLPDHSKSQNLKPKNSVQFQSASAVDLGANQIKRNVASKTSSFSRLKCHPSIFSSFSKDGGLVEGENVRLTGTEALKYYKQFTSLEKELKIQELKDMKDWVIENYKWRIDIVNQLSATAKAYYSNPQGEVRKIWKDLQRDIKQKSLHSLTDTRFKQAELKQFIPYFTYLIVFVHIMTFCVITSIGGVTSIGLEQSLYLQENTKTFIGTETIHRWTTPNIWIGPDMEYMIKAGAVYAPCIRRDYSLQIQYLRQYVVSQTLGCCEVLIRNTAGTTTQDECDKYTNGVGSWRTGVPCSKRQSGQNYVSHILHPCCVGLKAKCQLISHEHCLFLGGTFHKDKDHCTQVNCLNGLCGFTGSSESTSDGFPVSPYQAWRVFVALFYCHGVIHLILILFVEWLIMRSVERSSGWLRLMLIFLISGMTSVVAASIISPYLPQVGSTGAVFGAVGVSITEVIQAWKITNKPWKELIKIILVITFFLISGLLPLVSNFAVLTGITMGIFSSMLLLPYITLGLYERQGRIALIIISIPLLFMMFFVIFYTYVKVQNVQLCKGCQNFECFPFSDKICSYG